MLYSEFLRGIGRTESAWNYSEYERINAIYNENNDMEKIDAYLMYVPKPQFVADLERENENLQNRTSALRDDYNSTVLKLFDTTQENKRLQERVEYLERIIHSAYHQMNK